MNLIQKTVARNKYLSPFFSKATPKVKVKVINTDRSGLKPEMEDSGYPLN